MAREKQINVKKMPGDIEMSSESLKKKGPEKKIIALQIHYAHTGTRLALSNIQVNTFQFLLQCFQ